MAVVSPGSQDCAENTHCSSFTYIGNILFVRKMCLLRNTEEIQFSEYTRAIGEAGEADIGAEIRYTLP